MSVGTKVKASTTIINGSKYIMTGTIGEIVKICRCDDMPLYQVRFDGMKIESPCFAAELEIA